MKKLITLLTMALMLFTGTALAGEVCTTWDLNTTDGDVVGYRIFVKAETEPEYDYNTPIWEGPLPPASILLADGVVWNLVCRVYDTEDLESADSNELSWFNEHPWVNTPPGTIELRIIDCADLPL